MATFHNLNKGQSVGKWKIKLDATKGLYDAVQLWTAV